MADWPAAVIFDFDGVLVSSEPLHFRALQAVLAKESLPLSESEYYRALLGMTDRDTFIHLFQKDGRELGELRLQELLQQKSAFMLQLISRGEMKLLEGAEDFVRRLGRHCPLAICSGSRRVEIETALLRAGLRECFARIVSADDFTIGKPDPRIYLRALEELGQAAGRPLQPQECLVVEDSPTVVQRLHPCGFRILAITSSLPAEHFPLAHWISSDLRGAGLAAADWFSLAQSPLPRAQ